PEPRIERPPRVLAPVVLVEPQARRDLKAAERHLRFGEFAPQLSRLHAREDVALGDRDAQVAELDRGLDVEAVGSAIELEVGPGRRPSFWTHRHRSLPANNQSRRSLSSARAWLSQ